MKRSQFLMAAAAASAAAGFLRKVALAEAIGDGDDAAFEALIATLLPVGSSGFPGVTTVQMRMRVDTIFDLSRSPAFVSSLGAFADIASFSSLSPALSSAEAKESGAIDREQLAVRDGEAFRASGLPSEGTFALLPGEQRRRYLGLWQKSAFNVRRRFYRSIRAVTLTAFYSLPQSWLAIGYAGPLLSRGHVE